MNRNCLYGHLKLNILLITTELENQLLEHGMQFKKMNLGHQLDMKLVKL